MFLSWLRPKRSTAFASTLPPPGNNIAVTTMAKQALAQLQAGQLGLAEKLYRQILLQIPQHFEALHMLGVIALQREQFNEAEPLIRSALKVNPQDAAAHYHLGALLKKNGELSAAIACLSRATTINPTLLPALQNLAQAHFDLGNIEESVQVYTRLVTHPGADAATHYAFGNALEAAGKTDQALKQYQSAIRLEPEYANARWAMAMAQLRPIYKNAKEIEKARLAFANAIAALEIWFTPARTGLGAKAVGTTQPFYLAYQAHDNRLLLQMYGRLCSRLMHTGVRTAWRSQMKPIESRKLRIGFASAFVHHHSVWNAITRGWITHLDPTRFEVHVFHLGRSSDAETAHARREATDFVYGPRSSEDWAQAIHEAQLDALIYPDIGMHPLTTQLAVQRLVPVQAASWGHPDTTGLPTIDLFLSAELFEPVNGDAHYSEELVRLPNLGVCVESLNPVADAPDLTALGLPVNEVLLLCAGQLFKYSPAQDAVWANLGSRLQALGEGRLVFFRSPRTEMTRQFEQRLRRAFISVGVDFDRTVCLIDTLPREQFYGLMQRATLMLDTIGFSGFNTALQGLACGLPLVAHEGVFMRGRLASGLLHRMDLGDWVATTNTEFIDKAMRLVVDEPCRLELHQQIVDRRALLFNDLEPVRVLEQVLIDAVSQGTPAIF